ncbi:oxidoreductase [Streptomyces sp. SID2955]|nr:oxidoreductase [Streptomyces sp. SID2955]
MLNPAPVAAAAAHDARRIAGERRLTAQVAEAVSAQGFARHFVPERWGGRAGAFRQLLDASVAVAEECASTAWCATLFAAHGRLAAYLPEEGQRDLWAASPDVRIAAAVVPPSGHATRQEDGWRLTGSWRYASGIDVADWVLLGSSTPAAGAEPGAQRDHRVFAVPRAEVDVQDTWHAMGLRGTGSNTVTTDGVFVPAHRSFTVGDLMRPMPGAARCHSVPFPMVAALMFAAPALGAARAALSAWRTEAKDRAAGPAGGLAPRLARTYARVSGELRAAELLLTDVAERADTAPVTALAVAECRRDATRAAAMCARATDLLFRTTGAHGLLDGNAVQDHWRDVTAVTAHATLDPDAAGEDWARAELEAM